MCFCTYEIHIETWQPFKFKNCTELVIIFTRTQIKKDSVNFVLHCLAIGERAIKDFYKTCLKEKSDGLFARILLLSRKYYKSKHTPIGYDLTKETQILKNHWLDKIMFIDITQPLMSEISPTSFLLRKNGHLRKRNKAELASETRKLISKD